MFALYLSILNTLVDWPFPKDVLEWTISISRVLRRQNLSARTWNSLVEGDEGYIRPPQKNIKHMHGNILYICDFWVDPVVHLLLHGQGLTSVLGLYNNRCLWSKSTSNRRPCPQSCNQKSNLLPKNIFSFLRDINPASFKLAFTNKITISPILLILSCSSLSLSAIISTDQLSIKIFLTHSCLFIEVTIRFEGWGYSSV